MLQIRIVGRDFFGPLNPDFNSLDPDPDCDFHVTIRIWIRNTAEQNSKFFLVQGIFYHQFCDLKKIS